MHVNIQLKGYKEAREYFRKSADILAGTRGQFYQCQSAIIKTAINDNSDASYTNSPAKKMALQSAGTWTHVGRAHQNNIFSTAYANYRQYGCGGIKITILVQFTAADSQRMLAAAIDELGKA